MDTWITIIIVIIIIIIIIIIMIIIISTLQGRSYLYAHTHVRTWESRKII